jgi:hypothetical protein
MTDPARSLTDQESRRRTTMLMRRITAIGIAWFLLGFALYLFRFHYGLSDQGKDWNDFGVFIAGFSGTGIATITLYAVSFGIRVQAEDLAKSRAFMADQSETMAKQAFDSVFFNLLDRFSEVRDSVSIPIKMPKRVPGRDILDMEEVYVTGRRAFEEFYRCLFQSQIGMQKAVPNRLAILQRLFLANYELAESELGPYFRTLYQIFKWIDRAALTHDQKTDYAKMARAQLSDLELSVIFYDGLTELAVKMKPLIEKYGILKHVNPGHLLQKEDKRDPMLYEASAFR